MNKQDKIYVAGHTGLVGSAIVKALKKKGHTNIVGRTHGEMDLCDTHAVRQFFDEEKPDYVFIAAAKVGGIVANNTYRAEFIFDNTMINTNLIDQSYRHGVKKLLFMGSTCIYPKECPQPMRETSFMTSPLEYTNEPYAIAKVAGMKMCESYNIQYDTNFISVMPTNLYGPNDNYDLEKSHVLPALMRKMHLGKCLQQNDWQGIRDDLSKRPVEGISGEAAEADILRILDKYGIRHDTADGNGSVAVEIWGSGKPTREFMWSEELGEACVYLMEKVNFSDLIQLRGNSFPDNEIRNTHINIGTGREITIRELAELVREKVGFDGRLFFNTEKPDGTMLKMTDVSKLHSLGWHHQIEIEEGIERYYRIYQETVAEKVMNLKPE
jgi:GDP-L-fucose synthase